MGGLGHQLEERGLPTTQISLIRKHSEITQPPRALWVPFELGRPLGVPGDAAFQRRVLEAVLRLLERKEGPVLEDWDEEAPASGADSEGWACPIPLRVGEAADPATDPVAALDAEILGLIPWYERARSARGRTTVGVSGLDIRDAGRLVAEFLEPPWPDNPRSDLSRAEVFKLACEDLKAFYLEAISAQPGAPGPARLADWFWGETLAGEIMLRLKPICLSSDDSEMRFIGKVILVPRAQAHRVPDAPA